MKVKQIIELSDILGEGFFADRVFNEKDFISAFHYVREIKAAREEILEEILGKKSLNTHWTLEGLHKLNRFYDWFHKNYGNTECHNYGEAENFLIDKLEAIGKDTSDFVSFWSYLRNVTLSEGSKIMDANI